MVDAMVAKFQFLWSVMYSSYEEFEEKLSLYRISFIAVTYTCFITSYHTGIFTGKGKK